MRIKKETLQSILLVSPSVLAVGIFVYGFLAWTARVSVSAWNFSFR